MSILKALTFSPTGGIAVAASTTSLPEQWAKLRIGGQDEQAIARFGKQQRVNDQLDRFVP